MSDCVSGILPCLSIGADATTRTLYCSVARPPLPACVRVGQASPELCARCIPGPVACLSHIPYFVHSITRPAVLPLRAHSQLAHSALPPSPSMPLPVHDSAANPPLPMEDNHYATLGVKPTASEDVIRSSFKSLSLTCHPDKLRRATANDGRAAQAKAEAQVKWDRIEAAHQVLSDPLARAFYDLTHGFIPDSQETHARIARLKRKDAQRAVTTMEETVAHNRAMEEAKQGLLIVEARYGDLSVSEEEAARAVSAPYIDVAVPLQYQVSDSSLVFPAGTSRAWLEGFYDPSMGVRPEANRLRIRYKFLGSMHQVEYDDQESIAIPLQEHCIQDELDAEEAEAEADMRAGAEGEAQAAQANQTRSSFGTSGSAGRASVAGGARMHPRASSIPSAHTRATLMARKKARRRMMLYSALALAGVTFYVLRSRPEGARATINGWIEAVRKLFTGMQGTPVTPANTWQQRALQAPVVEPVPAAATSAVDA